VGLRREARELALQALYTIDMNPMTPHAAVENVPESRRSSTQAKEFAELLVTGVVSQRAVIDERIGASSKNWTIGRMARVDLNLLRLAVYELLFCPDIPKSVTLNEAIEVAKKFGSEDSAPFVNGILDEVATSIPDKE
jgi:N utilization substance protein B